ncbi:MAG: hypothetical protein ABI224_11775, partial [Acetobacteraceae bacterium]
MAQTLKASADRVDEPELGRPLRPSLMTPQSEIPSWPDLIRPSSGLALLYERPLDCRIKSGNDGENIKSGGGHD